MYAYACMSPQEVKWFINACMESDVPVRSIKPLCTKARHDDMTTSASAEFVNISPLFNETRAHRGLRLRTRHDESGVDRIRIVDSIENERECNNVWLNEF